MIIFKEIYYKIGGIKMVTQCSMADEPAMIKTLEDNGCKVLYTIKHIR